MVASERCSLFQCGYAGIDYCTAESRSLPEKASQCQSALMYACPIWTIQGTHIAANQWIEACCHQPDYQPLPIAVLCIRGLDFQFWTTFGWLQDVLLMHVHGVVMLFAQLIYNTAKITFSEKYLHSSCWQIANWGSGWNRPYTDELCAFVLALQQMPANWSAILDCTQ